MPSLQHRDNTIIRGFRETDMFGHKLHFNVNGEKSHKTIPGACASLFIFAWLAVIL